MKVKLGKEYVTLDGSVLTITTESSYPEGFIGQISGSEGRYSYRPDGICWWYNSIDYKTSTPYSRDNYNLPSPKMEYRSCLKCDSYFYLEGYARMEIPDRQILLSFENAETRDSFANWWESIGEKDFSEYLEK